MQRAAFGGRTVNWYIYVYVYVCIALWLGGRAEGCLWGEDRELVYMCVCICVCMYSSWLAGCCAQCCLWWGSLNWICMYVSCMHLFMQIYDVCIAVWVGGHA